MTAVLAWVDADASYLIADSGESFSTPAAEVHGLNLTTETRLPQPASSIGQRQKTDAGAFVVERASKLVRLRHDLMAALVGNAGAAVKCAVALERQLRSGLGLKEALSKAAGSLYVGDLHFEMVIAATENGVPVIHHLRSHPWEMVTLPAHTVHAFGSIRNSPALDEVLAAPGRVLGLPSPQLRLIAALAELMTVGLTRDLVADFVGGSFFGGFVSKAQAFWQPRIFFYPYSPDEPGAPGSADFVLTEVLGDIAISTTTMRGDGGTGQPSLRRILAPVLEHDTAAWLEKHEAELAITPTWPRAEFVVLIPRTTEFRRVLLTGDSSQRRVMHVANGGVYIHVEFAAWLSKRPKQTQRWQVLPYFVAFDAPPSTDVVL
jgi:hypothetical protein